jgi:FAD/FMN-containing dehydrogenase
LEWKNWSGRLSSSPTKILQPRDEAAVIEAVLAARDTRSRIRCVGAAHSHAPLVVTDETLIDVSLLSGVLVVDSERRQATVAAGTRIAALGEPLRDEGLALHNQGDIDRQAIAGAVATGTHGTGTALRNLSASVVGARVVLADGTVVECDANEQAELFEVCRLSLGAVGVVTQLSLSLRDAYKLEERMWLENLEGILDRIDDLTMSTRHFEFFWLPGKERASCKSLAESRAEPRYPLAAEGTRLAWSYEVLANDRPDKHTEMEYSIPAESGPECFRALREMITREFPALAWPLEYRTLASDDVWLSPANGRPTVTISIHQGVDLDEEPLFRASEEVFRTFGGRPHWGKVNYLGGKEFEAMHSHWGDWWRVRDDYDPDRSFLNPYLGSLVGR